MNLLTQFIALVAEEMEGIDSRPALDQIAKCAIHGFACDDRLDAAAKTVLLSAAGQAIMEALHA